ncbi:YtcA family lipoprotein [Klebsiella variicola]
MKANYYHFARKVLNLAGVSIFTPALTGCTFAPSVALFGATFPDWILCIGAGCFIVLTIHALLRGGKFREWLEPTALVYPCMTALVTMCLWLLLFPA